MQIQKNIKRYRMAKNLTQEDLATILNVTRQTISKWEQGINEPDISTLKRLSEVFEISLDELVGEEKPNRRDDFLCVVKFFNFFSIAVCILSCLFLIIFTRYLYNKIPMHYNWAGEVDRYGSKWEWLYLLPYFIVIAVVDILCSRYIGRHIRYKKDKVGFWIIKACCWSCQIVGLGIFFGFTMEFLKKNTWYPITNCVVYAILFCLFLFMHPAIVKRNTIFGFRTELTCSNDMAWNLMNRFSCYTFCTTSIVAIIVQMLVNQFWLNFLISEFFCVGLIIVFIYYIYVKHKLK